MSPVNDRGAISADELALLSLSAELLFQNGQTTRSTTATVARLAAALGHRALLFARWGEIGIRIDGPIGGLHEVVGAAPAGVDMNKVVAAMKVIDDVCDGRINVTAARPTLEAIARYPPVGVARFALFAGAGAAALGVIFGTVHWHALILIAFSAGLGACLRRWLAGPSFPIPLAYDVTAAAVAVAAYGTFFAMPWRMLPIPTLIGAFAHACRWAVISIGGGSIETGALVACLVVGTLITPIADRLRLPFAAVGFASVVSLIPGVFLFRMAGGLVELISHGGSASPDLLLSTVMDGMTAFSIFLAMAFGLIAPKMLIEHFRERRPSRP